MFQPMLSAIAFYTFLFLALVVIPTGLVLGVLLFLVYGHQFWKRMGTVSGPAVRSLARRPAILVFWKRFPRTAALLGRRLDRHDPWGLPGTIAGIGILLGLWFFIGVLQDIVAKDPLVILDVRLHNAIPLFRTTGMTWFMLALTQLGSTAVLALLCLGVALLALARNQPRLATTLVLSLAGTGLVSSILKALFGHARPLDALIQANEASFPSGHTLSGTVVYGLLAALLFGSQARRGTRALGVTLLLLIIVGIGLSRLYLGVHWPSDVLGSLALALILLPPPLFFLHYDRPVRWFDTIKSPFSARATGIAGGTVLILCAGAAAWQTMRTATLPIEPDSIARPLDITALPNSVPADFPRWSEDLVGGKMEPISLVLVGSQAEMLAAFARAGWARADLPTPSRVMREALAAIRDQPDPSGPATPAFVADRPQDLTFEKPDAGFPGIRHRHHTRVWRTTYCDVVECRPVWVATASFDIGVGISPRLHLPTHRIDPAIDKERSLIVTDLTAVGARELGSISMTSTLRGKNAAGDPFSTDGRAVLMVLARQEI